MSTLRLLLLSNSTCHGQGWLEHAVGPIQDFLGETVRTIAFVPFAGVTIGWDDYAGRARERFKEMGYEIHSVHEAGDAADVVGRADAVAVGGGNTFRLIEQLHETGLLDVIRGRVLGGVPYIGWSAGSNVVCPSIRTTNDMPIVEPPSFAALNLVSFQINPHYLDAQPTGHQGETREQRIEEFVEVNPDVYVVGLREGSTLRVEGRSMQLLGGRPARIFRKGTEPRECTPADDLGFLLR